MTAIIACSVCFGFTFLALIGGALAAKNAPQEAFGQDPQSYSSRKNVSQKRQPSASRIMQIKGDLDAYEEGRWLFTRVGRSSKGVLQVQLALLPWEERKEIYRDGSRLRHVDTVAQEAYIQVVKGILRSNGVSERCLILVTFEKKILRSSFYP